MKKLKKLLRHLFIPHEGNNYRAKALHIDFLTYYLLFAIFLTFAFKILSVASSNILGIATDITVDKLYQLTNGIRQQNNLSTLEYNEQLAQAAQKKAADMLTKNYWSHYGPNGETPWEFILSSGYKYETAGENLAKNFLYSQGVLDAWMNSTTHRDNILRKDYTQIGFALVNGSLNGEETTLVVQMFGKPLGAPLAKERLTFKQPEVRPQTVKAEEPIITQSVQVTTIAKNATNQEKSVILAQKSTPAKNNLTLITFNSSIIFLIFFALALIMDLYFATKLRIIRITGKNLAHLIFIGFIFMGLLLVTKGSIL